MRRRDGDFIASLYTLFVKTMIICKPQKIMTVGRVIKLNCFKGLCDPQYIYKLYAYLRLYVLLRKYFLANFSY